MNPFNYNVWCFRRKILKNIKYDPQKEICFSEEIIRNNPKNNQAWEHRRSVAINGLNFCDVETELDLTHSILKEDSKNYHAWQHRQWTLQTFKFSKSGLLQREFNYTDEMICEDIRNNSAWNQRFYVLRQQGKYDFIIVKREFCYVIEKVKQVLNNESAWNYMRGINDIFPNIRKLPQYDDFLNFLCRELYENKNHCPQLVSFIIDMKIDIILNFCESNEMIQTNKVHNLCILMSEQLDTIRSNYWKFVSKKLLFDKITGNDKNDLNESKNNKNWKFKIWKKYDNINE